MLRVSKDALKVGMILAKPICGQKGMVMLAAGTELTEKWIDRIQDMDVTGITVEGASEPKTSKEEAVAALDERFSAVLHAPHMDTIKNVVRKHIESLYP